MARRTSTPCTDTIRRKPPCRIRENRARSGDHSSRGAGCVMLPTRGLVSEQSCRLVENSPRSAFNSNRYGEHYVMLIRINAARGVLRTAPQRSRRRSAEGEIQVLHSGPAATQARCYMSRRGAPMDFIGTNERRKCGCVPGQSGGCPAGKSMHRRDWATAEPRGLRRTTLARGRKWRVADARR